jgi:hypothetical protein
MAKFFYSICRCMGKRLYSYFTFRQIAATFGVCMAIAFSPGAGTSPVSNERMWATSPSDLLQT